MVAATVIRPARRQLAVLYGVMWTLALVAAAGLVGKLMVSDWGQAAAALAIVTFFAAAPEFVYRHTWWLVTDKNLSVSDGGTTGSWSLIRRTTIQREALHGIDRKGMWLVFRDAAGTPLVSVRAAPWRDQQVEELGHRLGVPVNWRR